MPVPASVASVLSTSGASRADARTIWSSPDPNGGALRVNAWRARYWQPAIKTTGLAPLRPHDLRHTAVSLWIAAGASPKQVATWAGHTSVALVLDRDGHLLPGHEEVVLAALDGFAEAPPEPAGDLLALPVPKIPRGFAG